MKKIVLVSFALLFIALIGKSQPINFSWAKAMGGKAADGSVGLAKDASGNLYVTGEFYGTRTFGPFTLTSAGTFDMFVAKYSSSGTCLWVTQGGAQFSEAYGGKLAVSGNEVYVTGSFSNIINIDGQIISSNGNKDIFVAGLDATTGACTWIDKAGSIFDDIPYGIELATGGGFFLCGTFTGTATFGSNTVASSNITDYDVFYAKYTNTGSCTWVNRIGSTGIDKAYAIKELPSGDLLLTGCFSGSVLFGPGSTLTSAGFTDFFLAKFNSTGQFTWATSGGCDLNDDCGFGISFDPAGNIYTTGYIGDTATFGSVVINQAGGINVLVAKFSPNGVCQWGRTGGTVADDMGNDIVTDFGGSSYVTGYINGSCYFGTTQVSGVNYIDIFIAKYDMAGGLRWITKVGGNIVDKGRSILLDANGYCYVAGDFANTAVFGVIGLTSDPGATGIFLTRMGGGTVGLNEIENAPVSIYPNPAADCIYLNLDQITDDAFTVSLVTIDGKQVESKTLSAKEAVAGYKLDLKHIAPGSYLVKIETSKGDFTKTIVIQ